jgi:L-lactate dehydrogenase complex protein LldG
MNGGGMKTPIDLLESLEKELAVLYVKTYRADSREALWEIIETLLSSVPGQKVGLENRPLIKTLNLEKALKKEGRDLWGFSSNSRKATLAKNHWQALEAIEVGIGGADYALADTGTLVLFSKESAGRWVSLAPPIHIALLPAEKILPSLDDLMDHLALEKDLSDLGSALIFITGPSRTADIELNLVMGAHGPKALHVITLLFPC